MNWNDGFENYNSFIKNLNETVLNGCGYDNPHKIEERLHINRLIRRLGLDCKLEIRNAKVEVLSG